MARAGLLFYGRFLKLPFVLIVINFAQSGMRQKNDDALTHTLKSSISSWSTMDRIAIHRIPSDDLQIVSR